MAGQNDDFGMDGIPPEFAAQAAALRRRERLAEAMMARGMQPQPAGQMVGRFYVPAAPFTGVSNMISGFANQAQLSGIDKERAALGEQYRQAQAQAVKDFVTGGQPQFKPQSDAEESMGVTPQAFPVDPASRHAKIIEAMTSPYPGLRNIAGMEYANLSKAEQAKRDWEMKLQYEPQLAGATEGAKNPALMARKQAEIDAETKAAPIKAAGEAQARLPYQQDLAAFNAKLDIAKAGPVAMAQAGAQQPGKDFERANKLRDEFSALTKDFRTVQDAYQKIQSTSDTGAGDMSLLYSYVKLLDPGSVVRESEFATAAASGSFGEQVQGAVQRVLSGQRLPPTLRAAFKNEATNIYGAQRKGFENISKTYGDLAGKYGIPVDQVVYDYSAGGAAPVPQSSGAPAVGERKGGYRFKGGDPSSPASWERVE